MRSLTGSPRDIVLSLLVGLAVGALVGGVKLPVPAPPTVAGIAGILGITVGWWLIRRFVT